MTQYFASELSLDLVYPLVYFHQGAAHTSQSASWEAKEHQSILTISVDIPAALLPLPFQSQW